MLTKNVEDYMHNEDIIYKNLNNSILSIKKNYFYYYCFSNCYIFFKIFTVFTRLFILSKI